MLQQVKKRDGRIVSYQREKIEQAILKAMHAAQQGNQEDAQQVALQVEEKISHFSQTVPEIEAIQNVVEQELMQADLKEAAKQYILYRAHRTAVRETKTSLMQAIDEITNTDARKSNLKRDNANIDGNTAMGSMLQIGTAGAKAYNAAYLLTQQQAKAHKEGDIHIHDFDFYALTTTCCQIDLIRLFENGFSTGHGYLREPQSIGSYASLAAIAIQANQNDQHGGQGIPNFDYAMAQGVAKSFARIYQKQLQQTLEDILDTQDETELAKKACTTAQKQTGEPARLEKNEAQYDAIICEMITQDGRLSKEKAQALVQRVRKRTKQQTERDTYQAMEGFIHNLNTMHSRAGAQTPFSSINYGTDCSPEGRMVIRNLLLAEDAGLGHGETPIFPIHIFKVKEGVNYETNDPNYDLFQLSCKVSAKRLFPNYLFLDSPFNLQYYQKGRPETEVATMGCRTRVMGNVFDSQREISYSRGNLSFTSINLPRLALESKGDEALFYKKLDEMMELVAQQLWNRFEIQAAKRVYHSPFLMGQGVWLDAQTLNWDDEVGQVLRHGSLSIGFIGLAETLTALYGAHHGQSEEMQQKGLEIVQYMRDFCDKKSQETKMNYALLATPAEGLAGRFVEIDKKRYGVIPGVTDRSYYTNSFHIPVWYEISVYDKIKKEAPYHALTNGGHISYVELDGDTANNVEAFETVVRCMHDAGIGYGSINHPVDRDPVCGYVGIIGEVCPRCGRKSGEALTEEQLQDLKKRYPNAESYTVKYL